MKIPQDRTRYVVYAEWHDARQEVGIGVNLDQQIEFARCYNSRTGSRMWINSTATGALVFSLPRRTPRAQGAGGGQ